MPDQPTLAEVVALARSLATPPPAPPQAPENGILKAIAAGAGTILVALCIWVGSTISGLSNTMTKVSTNVDAMTKQIGDMQVTQQTTTGRMSDMQAAIAKNGSRIDAIADDQTRLRERMRIVEGQKPLNLGGGGA